MKKYEDNSNKEFKKYIFDSKLGNDHLDLIYEYLIKNNFIQKGVLLRVIVESLPKENSNMSYAAVWQESNKDTLITIDFALQGTHNASLIYKNTDGTLDDSQEIRAIVRTYKSFKELDDPLEGASLELRRRLSAVGYKLQMPSPKN